MTTIRVSTRDGTEIVVEGAEDMSVMEAIRRKGVDELLALCGGCLSCATCQIHVDPEQAHLLPAMSDDENELLDSSSHRTEFSRLSCQIPCLPSLDGLRVRIAAED